MKQALLTIVTKQAETNEEITFTTRTDCDITDEGVKINYDENLSEEDVVNTSLFIAPDSIFVQRKGDSGADMFFQNTATYETLYKATGGIKLDMRIFTTNLDIKSSDDGISASVDYQLFISGVSVGQMGMDIKVEYL